MDSATINALLRTLKEKTKWKTLIQKKNAKRNINREMKLKKGMNTG